MNLQFTNINCNEIIFFGDFMSSNNTNSKYIVWLYNLNNIEYKILKNCFPKEHFEIIDIKKMFQNLMN